jgi:suppressor of G2 allele of SKP1
MVSDIPQVTISSISSVPTGFFTLNLKGKIKPADTTYTVKSMKIELVLKKKIPGKWKLLRDPDADAKFYEAEQFIRYASELGFEPNTFNIQKFDGNHDAWYDEVYQKLFEKDTTDSTKLSQTPASLAESTEKPTALSEQPALTEKSAGPAYPTSSKSGPKNWDSMDLDVDEDKDDNVDDFFKKLYKDADPDTKRAMMKSYVESNGTSLSTSWSEASKKNYKTEPPEGAVAKKWDD